MKKILIVCLLLIAGPIFAEAAAKVLYTQNKVIAKRSGTERTLSRGATLEAGDEIITGKDAAINIQYTNGSLVNLGSDSNYKILAYAPNKDVQIDAELSKGKLEIKNAGKIKENLKTPIVSLAILGTHIRVDVTSSKMTYVQIIEGLVLARNEFLRPGDGVRVSADRIVSAPFPKEGIVNSPLSSPGKIESSDASSAVVDGAVPGAEIVTYVSSNLEVGNNTTTGTQTLIAATSMAEISLACN